MGFACLSHISQFKQNSVCIFSPLFTKLCLRSGKSAYLCLAACLTARPSVYLSVCRCEQLKQCRPDVNLPLELKEK